MHGFIPLASQEVGGLGPDVSRASDTFVGRGHGVALSECEIYHFFNHIVTCSFKFLPLESLWLFDTQFRLLSVIIDFLDDSLKAIRPLG